MSKIIIISDIHLGSENCQAKTLCEFLENVVAEDCSKLILNGDVFESMDFRRLNKHHWHVLSFLRKMSDRMEIIWILGNHDGPIEIISHLLGIEVKNDYEFMCGNKKILALHGHIFDDFISKHPFLTFFGDMIYNFLQKIDGSFKLAQFAKYNSKQYLRCSEIIKESALNLAKERECDVVMCGHSHHPVEDTSGNIHYYNSGSWTEKPCTYLSVSGSGKVRLEEV